jgi:hypothetical protein
MPARSEEKENANSLVIGSRTVRFAMRELPIDSLRYYTENPRIYSLVSSMGAEATQERIQAEIWKLDSTKDLYQDIRTAGGLLDEITVWSDTVLEGNRRLCAYRRLRDGATTSEERTRWGSILAKVLLDPLSPEDIFTLLGTLHIKGKAPWKPYEQAGYIYRMRHDFGKSSKQIALMIGLNEHVVGQMLVAYEMMRKDGIQDQEKYSYYLEYAKRPGFRELRKKDPNLDETVSGLIKDGRIERADQVRELEHILKDKKVKREFLAGSRDFGEALQLAHARNPEQVGGFYKKMVEVREVLRLAPIPQLLEDIQKDNAKRTKVDYFLKDVAKFSKAVGWDRGHWKGEAPREGGNG